MLNEPNASQSTTEFSVREPTFPSRQGQAFTEGVAPTTTTFYAVRSDQLAKRLRPQEQSQTQESKESASETSGVVHDVDDQTVRFQDKLPPDTNVFDSSHIYEMNTMTISQDIASFHVLKKHDETAPQVSELIFDVVQPEECDITFEQAQLISDTSVSTAPCTEECVLFTPDVRDLYFETVELQPSEIISDYCQILITEPRITCSQLAFTVATSNVVTLTVAQPTDRKKRTLTSTLQASCSKLITWIAQVFHQYCKYFIANHLQSNSTQITFPDTARNSTVLPPSLYVPHHKTLCSAYDISKPFSQSGDDTIFATKNDQVTAFVDTQRGGHSISTTLPPVSKSSFLSNNVENAKVFDLEHEFKNGSVHNTSREVSKVKEKFKRKITILIQVVMIEKIVEILQLFTQNELMFTPPRTNRSKKVRTKMTKQ